VDGSWSNVKGLPMERLSAEMQGLRAKEPGSYL
jgi:hypothetical protein